MYPCHYPGCDEKFENHGGKFSTANQKDVLTRFCDVMLAPKEAPSAK